ncbi:MAG: acylneuraminate cytidylyltransferase [Spirochaetia bacterium]|jgi:spore coat polysaccharide biosynthesis protein SpsF|nr:acylneuraminate cytidylyltransferase [Spirochaetia bacterium]
MTGVFLQVRLDSTRLPGKALLPLEDYTVIEQAMRSLKVVRADIFSLITDPSSASQLVPLAKKWGFEIFIGDKENVLKRFADAIKFYAVSTVIRATGDNPLVSGELANNILEYHKLKNADYSGYTGIPLGTGVEILNSEAILKANSLSDNVYEQEHVSPYLYYREKEFVIKRVPVSAEFYCPDGKVTLDTSKDYYNIKQIYRQLYQGQPIGIQNLVTWFRMNIPEEYYALAQ